MGETQSGGFDLLAAWKRAALEVDLAETEPVLVQIRVIDPASGTKRYAPNVPIR